MNAPPLRSVKFWPNIKLHPAQALPQKIDSNYLTHVKLEKIGNKIDEIIFQWIFVQIFEYQYDFGGNPMYFQVSQGAKKNLITFDLSETIMFFFA